MRISRAMSATVVVAVLAAACAAPAGPAVGLPPASAPAAAASGLAGPVYPGTDEGARALMTRLGAVGDRALMQALQPAADDYGALFEPSFATRARTYYTRLWTTLPASDHPLAGREQTELALYKGATEQVRAWTPPVKAEFPAGYKLIKEQFRPGFTVYVGKYSKPGRKATVVCNGLVFVNGHWAYFPAPWKVR